MWWFYGVKDVESFTVLLETKSLHDISGTCAQMMANVQLGRWIDVFCYKRFCQWGNCSDSQPKAEGTHSGNLMEQPKHYFSAYMTSLIKWSCWGWGFFVFVSSLTKLNTALWRMFFLVCNMFQHQLCNSKYTSSNIDTSQNTAINMFDKWKKNKHVPNLKIKFEVYICSISRVGGELYVYISCIYHIYPPSQHTDSFAVRRQPPSRLLVPCFAPWSHVCPVEARIEGITRGGERLTLPWSTSKKKETEPFHLIPIPKSGCFTIFSLGWLNKSHRIHGNGIFSCI